MARHEHRAPAGRLGAHQVAHPADAGRVEAVGRLVEDQHVGIAQQRRGDREPLAHAHRVALHAPVGGAGQVDLLEHLAHARLGVAAGGGEHAQVVAAAATRDGSSPPRAPRRRGRSGAAAARSGRRRRWPCRRCGWIRPSSVRSVVLLPAPLGPRKPVTRPNWTEKDRSLTAWTLPKLLLRPVELDRDIAHVGHDTAGPGARASGARMGFRLIPQDERGRTRPTSYA